MNNILKLFPAQRISALHIRKMSVEKTIRDKITENLKPIHFEVINESPMHSVPKNSETHFKILVVSDLFKGLPLIKRHRMVNDLVKDQFDKGLHALSIVALSGDQWETREKKVESSPNCRGGYGK